MWREETRTINGEVFKFWYKQYDEGSEYGIDNGRISKLTIKRNDKIVYNYDRGLDVPPADKNTELALEMLLHNENY